MRIVSFILLFHRSIRAIVAVAVAGVAGSFLSAAEEQPSAEALKFFETEVRPILAGKCYECHGPKKQSGELRLDSLAAILTGGESGAAIVAGNPDQSILIDAIHYGEREMPPDERLNARQIAVLSRWVKIGAPWPDAGPLRPAVEQKHTPEISAEDRAYWAFQPVARPSLPEIQTSGLAANPIDTFVLARLAAEGLKLSPPASRRELVRRANFDLIGLPPAPEEVDAYLDDSSPGAYERLIDRLLAMPQYGERWGRHWLDAVRFAQTNGYERDDEKPFAWRYRNYVIGSLNQDKPYDRFVLEQLAGDELNPVTDDSLIATAFYRLGVWDDEPDDARQAEFDALDDILVTTGSALLGLTIGCARCHEHKFDPIPQEDYYRMLAFFRNVKHYVKAEDKSADETIFAKLVSGGKTLSVREHGPGAPKTHVLIRGNAGTPGREVQPRFLEVLCTSRQAASPDLSVSPVDRKTSGRRLALAKWIASRENPLTARVIANRLWHHHFGRGIVATPSDFGRTGSQPTHPNLLDWLAAELVAGDWRLKRLHRLIVTSSTYRQSSRADNVRAVRLDPDNTLLWRQNMRRLEAEAIRDCILAVSGQLNLKMGGRGIFPALSAGVLASQSRPGSGWDKSSAAEQARRSVYIFVKRTLGVPLMETFDAASPDTSTAARNTTTIAPQALILLNSQFTEDQSARLAERLVREREGDRMAQIERAYRLAMSRPPTLAEQRIALDYMDQQRRQWDRIGAGDAERHALQSFCKVLLNLNEFVYVD